MNEGKDSVFRKTHFGPGFLNRETGRLVKAQQTLAFLLKLGEYCGRRHRAGQLLCEAQPMRRTGLRAIAGAAGIELQVLFGAVIELFHHCTAGFSTACTEAAIAASVFRAADRDLSAPYSIRPEFVDFVRTGAPLNRAAAFRRIVDHDVVETQRRTETEVIRKTEERRRD